MCYNKSSSINAFTIGLLSSLLLYKNKFTERTENHKVFQQLALFFAFVSLMQIYDAIFWSSLQDNDGKNNTNYVFTKLAMITNHLQPIVLAYLINQYIELNDITKIVLAIYTFVALVYSIEAYQRIDYTIVTKESAPALHWEWNTLENTTFRSLHMYGLFLTVLSLISLQLPYPISYVMLFINLATFLFSKYTYKILDIGRMWCHIAAYIPLLLLIFEMSY